MRFVPDAVSLNRRIMRRLLPLYVAAFFQGFVLWYTIEKLYMHTIGFDDAGIAVMVAAYSAIMLVVETPSGILADRWSRKGVLMLASISLAISSLICGLSGSISVYLIGSAFWGIFFALYSGTYDSITYDLLLEETKSSDSYQHFYGRLKVVDSSALVLSSLAGGLVAGAFGLQKAFLLTIPFTLAAVVALACFKEPKLHKTSVAIPIKEQVISTFSAVLRQMKLFPVLAVLIIFGTLTYTLFEFTQLWWIALALPATIFGPFNALVISTTGLGGLASEKFSMHRPVIMRLTLLAMLLASIGLVGLRFAPALVVCQMIIGIGLIGLYVVFNKMLHDALPSAVRAGAASAVSSMTRIVLIPVALLFGFVSKELSVFYAGSIFFILLLLALVFVNKSRSMTASAVNVKDELVIEDYQK